MAAEQALSDVAWEPRYATARQDLVADFYEPALARSVAYDRATGFFRSSFFSLTREAVARFALDGGRIRLVCSPDLSSDDAAALSRGATADAVGSAALRREYERILENPHASTGLEVLGALLGVGALAVRIAMPSEGSGIFHDKFGIFHDSSGNLVSFSGSVNETWHGWHPLGNHETFEVFESWGAEAQRPRDHLAFFERLWTSRQPGLVVVAPSDELLGDMAARGGTKPRRTLAERIARRGGGSSGGRPLLDHQRTALREWIAAGRRGILEHATGSGKTVTALAAIRAHLQSGQPALVLVPSTLLLAQWDEEAHTELSDLDPAILLAGGRHRGWERRLRAFTAADGRQPRLVVATMATACTDAFLAALAAGPHLMLVADEVHRLGAAELGRTLEIESGSALGLSATPRRAGDPSGTARIFDYFGGVVPPVFTLADAIAAGRLCEYEYHVHPVGLTSEEQEAWSDLTSEIRELAARQKDDTTDFSSLDPRLQLLLIRRARIARGAHEKTTVAAQVVADGYSEGQSWLVYCDDVRQLDEVLGRLLELGIPAMPYHSAMAADRPATLDRFQRDGGVLVSIKCLDEGVDIPSVSHAVIAASSRNPREFIQRRGRVLRVHPDKRVAVVHDLIVTPPDEETDDFKSLALGELARAREFASHAVNASAQLDLEAFAIAWDLDPEEIAASGFEEEDG